MIDDAGNRDGVWFVVLRAADGGQADVWWQEVAGTNGLTVSDEQENVDSVTATLTGATIGVSALRQDQADGSVLLSYDITPVAV